MLDGTCPDGASCEEATPGGDTPVWVEPDPAEAALSADAALAPLRDGPLCSPPAPWPNEPVAAHITPRLAMLNTFTGRESRLGAWYNALGAYHGAMSPQG